MPKKYIDKTEKIEETQLLEDAQNKEIKILVVEDEPKIREFLIRALQRDNDKYQLQGAADGNEAKKMADKTHFDLILSDVDMPGASGIELLEHIKSNPTNTTEFILLTGKPDIEDAVDTVKGGAFDYLTKPIDLSKLRERIRAGLEAGKINKAKETLKRTQAMTKTDILKETAIGAATQSSIHGKSYRVIRMLGSGNIGTVFLIEKQNGYFAIKILKANSNESLNDRIVQRFLREGEIVSKLEHKGIVKVYEYGFGPNNTVPYIIMEFVDGNPLSDLINQNSLELAEKLSIISQIADALGTVHQQGIQHRDIKPSNVLISKEKIAKLTDFGIARLSTSTLTMTMEVLGSPAYMAPESFSGIRDVDNRADIFSFGVLAYELLTGILPFQGDSIPAIASAITNQKPIAPTKIDPTIPATVETILGKMMQKKPKDRYDNALEISKEIERVRKSNYTFSLDSIKKLFIPNTWQ